MVISQRRWQETLRSAARVIARRHGSPWVWCLLFDQVEGPARERHWEVGALWVNRSPVAAFILVHSPLVGPATWSWVADELGRRGHRVAVPSPAPSIVLGGWPAFVHAVVRQIVVDVRGVLVGHSGAGPLLPVIASQLEAPAARLVFVDAGVPPLRGEAALVPEHFRDSLTGLAQDGMLPKWSEWFGPGTMETLIPDPDRRATILAELPQIPLSFFDDPVPMPDAWSDRDCAYILLSDPYRSDADEAASRGWPVVELPGAHLDLVTRPAEVTEALLDVATPPPKGRSRTKRDQSANTACGEVRGRIIEPLRCGHR